MLSSLVHKLQFIVSDYMGLSKINICDPILYKNVVLLKLRVFWIKDLDLHFEIEKVASCT